MHSKNADPSCSLPDLCLPCVVLYIGAAERSFTYSSHNGDAGSIANKSISKNTVVAWLSPVLFLLAFLCWGGRRGNKQTKKAIWEVGFQQNWKKKSKCSALVFVLIHSFRLAIQVFWLPLVHHQSLVCSLRCRLNNNFLSIVSFLLAICTLWTCHIASLLYS